MVTLITVSALLYECGISSRLSGNCLGSSEQVKVGQIGFGWVCKWNLETLGLEQEVLVHSLAQQPIFWRWGENLESSTDMAVNPHTFGIQILYCTDADGAEFIDVQFELVWAAMLLGFSMELPTESNRLQFVLLELITSCRGWFWVYSLQRFVVHHFVSTSYQFSQQLLSSGRLLHDLVTFAHQRF
jgi:hypothetical protein